MPIRRHRGPQLPEDCALTPGHLGSWDCHLRSWHAPPAPQVLAQSADAWNKHDHIAPTSREEAQAPSEAPSVASAATVGVTFQRSSCGAREKHDGLNSRLRLQFTALRLEDLGLIRQCQTARLRWSALGARWTVEAIGVNDADPRRPRAAPRFAGLCRITSGPSADPTLRLVAAVLTAIVCAAQPLPRSWPEVQGVSSFALEDFVKALDGIRTSRTGGRAPWPGDRRRLVGALRRGPSARALFVEQELHLDRRRPRGRGGQAEPRRRGAEVLPRRRARECRATT